MSWFKKATKRIAQVPSVHEITTQLAMGAMDLASATDAIKRMISQGDQMGVCEQIQAELSAVAASGNNSKGTRSLTALQQAVCSDMMQQQQQQQQMQMMKQMPMQQNQQVPNENPEVSESEEFR